MTRNRLLLAALLLVAVLLAAGCGGKSGSSSSSNGVPSDAVAVVAGTPIPRSDLDELMHITELSYKQNKQAFPKAGTSEYQSLEQQAAAYLVTDKEYQLGAAQLGIHITDADVQKGIDTLIKRPSPQGFGGQANFDKYLKSTGFSMDDVRVLERRQLLRTRLFDTVTKNVKVTPSEIKAFYDAHKDQSPYSTPAQRNVRHILIAVNSKGVGVSEKGVTDTKVDYAKSKALADEVYKQLKNGADFKAMAKKYSQDPGTKDSGGVYLDVKGGGTAKEFEAVAFALKTHEISKPTKTQFGYHIIQALEPIKPGSTMSLPKAEKSIRATLLQQKKTTAISNWAKKLGARYKNKVKYASGFAPPTTSSTSTTTTP